MVKTLASDNSRFSSLFAAEDVSRIVPSGEEPEKRLFLQAIKTLVYWTTLGY